MATYAIVHGAGDTGSYVLCRDDRCFPADWLREVVRERLGVEPDEMDGGHCPYLSRPAELAERLEALRLG